MAVQLALLNDAVNPGTPSLHPRQSLPAAEWDEGLSPAMPPLRITVASSVPMVTPYPSADFFSLSLEAHGTKQTAQQGSVWGSACSHCLQADLWPASSMRMPPQSHHGPLCIRPPFHANSRTAAGLQPEPHCSSSGHRVVTHHHFENERMKPSQNLLSPPTAGKGRGSYAATLPQPQSAATEALD